MPPCDRLRRYIIGHGLTLSAPVADPETRSFEARCGLALPRELLQFYGCVNGMAPGEMDPRNLIRLWPVKEMTPVDAGLADSDGVRFSSEKVLLADYHYWALAYAVRISGIAGSTVTVVGEGHELEVAQSFEEFIEMILQNDSGLFPDRGPR